MLATVDAARGCGMPELRMAMRNEIRLSPHIHIYYHR